MNEPLRFPGRDGNTNGTRRLVTVRWDSDEESVLLREFRAGLPVPSIAEKHDRSTLAIWTRLLKLGEVTPEQVPGIVNRHFPK